MAESVALSMTGFGAADGKLAEGTVHIELRAVNHRHLDVRLRMPAELGEFAGLVEETIRAHAVRGRIEGVMRWDAPAAPSGGLDTKRATAVYRQLCALRDELAPGEP